MRPLREISAGGVILKDGQVLLVLMRNLKGGVWTYPKGHLEKGETTHSAAIREVFEETGYRCELISKKEIYISKYSFYRNGKYTKKKVYWYRMRPLSQFEGIQTPEEIIETAWVTFKEAAKLLFYNSDLKILKLTQKKLGGENGF